MRNYVMMQAEQRMAYGRLTKLMRIWHNWKNRKDLRRLLAMDDYMLRDVGLTRDELQRFARLPLTVDQAWDREQM